MVTDTVLALAPFLSVKFSQCSVAEVRFVDANLTISESDLEPTRVCLMVTGEFAGRSVCLTLVTDSTAGESVGIHGSHDPSDTP